MGRAKDEGAETHPNLSRLSHPQTETTLDWNEENSK